jgi:hypothetical protein
MNVNISKAILATVVLPESKDAVISGGAGPVYLARDTQEQQLISMYLSRITEGVIHDLENGVLIIVKH